LSWFGVLDGHKNVRSPTFNKKIFFSNVAWNLNYIDQNNKVNNHKKQHTPETHRLYVVTNAHILRLYALSLCFSAGEYASSVWSRSVHTKQIDTILYQSCRLVTGCLKSTPLPKIYQLAGIAPLNIRREVAAD